MVSFSLKSSVISSIITFNVAWNLSKVDISKALYKEKEKIERIIIYLVELKLILIALKK